MRIDRLEDQVVTVDPVENGERQAPCLVRVGLALAVLHRAVVTRNLSRDVASDLPRRSLRTPRRVQAFPCCRVRRLPLRQFVLDVRGVHATTLRRAEANTSENVDSRDFAAGRWRSRPYRA